MTGVSEATSYTGIIHYTSVNNLGGLPLIARTWRGLTASEEADAYVRYLEETGFREYRGAQGNLGILCLLHTEHDRTEFLLVSFWATEEHAVAFAGGDPTKPCSTLRTTAS